MVAFVTLLTVMEYLCHRWPRICSTCPSHNAVTFYSFMNYHWVTRVIRRVPQVEQELLNLLHIFWSTIAHQNCQCRLCFSIFSFLCTVVDHYMYFCPLSFGHWMNSDFWLTLWVHQTFLTRVSIRMLNCVDIQPSASHIVIVSLQYLN